MTEVRRIRPEEWPLLKQVRLAALSDSPEAFAETLEDAQAFSDAIWQRRASGSTSHGVMAFDGLTPVGMAVGLPGEVEPSHAYLAGMWVAPEQRGSEAATALLDAILAWASRRGATQLLAGVAASNARARTFYERNGFVEYDGPAIEHSAVADCYTVLSRPCGGSTQAAV